MRYRINIITEENLLKIGMLDDFYDLYLQISNIANEETIKILKGNNYSRFSTAMVNGHSFSELLRGFLDKHTYLFTDKFKRLYLNSGDLSAFRIMDEDVDMKTFKFIYKIGDFNYFLFHLEMIIKRSLFKRLKKEDNTLCDQEMIKMTKNHLLSFDRYSKGTLNIKEKNILEVSELYVFKNLSNVSCVKNDHYVVTEPVKVYVLDKSDYIILPIHKCLECEKCFIGEESLRLYEKKYGHMILIRNYREYEGYEWYEYAMESKLHSTGYNADSKTWTKEERQTLLVKLLEKGIMEFVEIVSDLENSIRRFKNNSRFRYALPKWKEDLLFLNECVLNKHNVD